MAAKLVYLCIAVRLMWEVLGPAFKLAHVGNYDHVLILLLEGDKLGNKKWNMIALFWRMDAAHEYMELLLICCGSQDLCWACQQIQQGKCLASIETAYFFDSGARHLNFQQLLLQKLVRLMCSGKFQKCHRTATGELMRLTATSTWAAMSSVSVTGTGTAEPAR